MKMNKLVFPLVIALAATLASTGCRKGTPKTTIIPGHNQQIVGDGSGAGTLPPGPPINPDNPPFGTDKPPGQIATADGWRVEDMNQDRAALAAYRVHFDFDSATVKKGEESNISAVASALASNSGDKLLIEGNCDERGTEEYNRSLGERRALALREALAKAGVDPARVRTISYGKDKPADSGHDEAAWAKNRRGDFILLHPKMGV